MTTSENDIQNKRATDLLDQLIFEQGLRIKRLFFDIELNLMLVLLTNGKVLNLSLAHFPLLQRALPEQLNRYELEGRGTSVSWEELNEDLSLKGFIKQAALDEALHHLAKVA